MNVHFKPENMFLNPKNEPVLAFRHLRNEGMMHMILATGTGKSKNPMLAGPHGGAVCPVAMIGSAGLLRESKFAIAL